jgi:2-keto-4-pentenoate hydratase/2-oxohepta-3-ene-1,7-dioic acid hydratase in catechol pathway
MTQWLRFERGGRQGFGVLHGDAVEIYDGDLFANPRPTQDTAKLSDLRVLTPCEPSKMICLWNNFRELAAKIGADAPEEPLYLLKAPSAFAAPGDTIHRPQSYAGKVVYEGELGIVIGRRCSNVGEAEARENIFGYTCINDVTAADLIAKTPNFPQWTRAKSFDGFGAFGPVIATDLDPTTLKVRTVLDGQERQNYPISDMIFPPAKLVSLLSHDMTLRPGDVIACGTSVGVGSMKGPTNRVEVSIEGIGTLSNVFAQ